MKHDKHIETATLHLTKVEQEIVCQATLKLDRPDYVSEVRDVLAEHLSDAVKEGNAKTAEAFGAALSLVLSHLYKVQNGSSPR